MSATYTSLHEQLKTIAVGSAWTPASPLVNDVVKGFLEQEPTWKSEAVRRDPALVEPEDKGRVPLKGEIPSDIIAKAEPQLNLYQGLHAIAFHRHAHEYYRSYEKQRIAAAKPMLTAKAEELRSEAAKDLLVARGISQGVRRLTAGIEIHPGADIGKNFFIDHGAGVVIGATARIGDDVFLYHNVTLGASPGKEVIDQDTGKARRHPKLGNRVMVSNSVNILGPVTIEDDVRISPGVEIRQTGKEPITIGKGAVIEDGVLVTQSVPPGVRVVGRVPNMPGVLEKDQIGTPIMVMPRARDGVEAETDAPPKIAVICEGLGYMGKMIEGLLHGTWRNRVEAVPSPAHTR